MTCHGTGAPVTVPQDSVPESESPDGDGAWRHPETCEKPPAVSGVPRSSGQGCHGESGTEINYDFNNSLFKR